jgi:hypothetical protein
MKLFLDEGLPSRLLNMMKIENGSVIFTLQNSFSVTLTLLIGDVNQWRLMNLEILCKTNPAMYKGECTQIYPTTQSAKHCCTTAKSAHLIYYNKELYQNKANEQTTL